MKTLILILVIFIVGCSSSQELLISDTSKSIELKGIIIYKTNDLTYIKLENNRVISTDIHSNFKKGSKVRVIIKNSEIKNLVQ